MVRIECDKDFAFFAADQIDRPNTRDRFQAWLDPILDHFGDFTLGSTARDSDRHHPLAFHIKLGDDRFFDILRQIAANTGNFFADILSR